MTKSRYDRVTISLPRETLREADRLAREADRPRSWVFAEAVRQYAARPHPTRPLPTPADGLGDSRRAQLVADLKLTPEQRVRAAEGTARATREPRAGVQRVVAFDRYEDYL